VEVQILNLYSNEVEENSNLKGHHGQSFLITIGEEQIIYDVGHKGHILLHNMAILGIEPKNITKMVVSHGHFDHTGGLPVFLDSRNTEEKIPLYAHTDFREEKLFKLGIIKKNLGCPFISKEQEKKIEFILSSKSQQIVPYLRTTGEITKRKEVTGVEPIIKHWENNKLVVDPILDDNSLVLSTNEGEVIITGCAHSGILNICEHVKNQTARRIRAIVGGTHMATYTPEEVLYVAEELKNKYDFPDLYLNHCTDKMPNPFVKTTKTIDILKNKFGEEKVKSCMVGTKINFKYL